MAVVTIARNLSIVLIILARLALSRPGGGRPSAGGEAPRCVCGGPCHGLKEWSTSEELAEWLGLEVTQLYWMRSRMNGPRGHKIGSGILYRRRDVEEWLLTRAEDE